MNKGLLITDCSLLIMISFVFKFFNHGCYKSNQSLLNFKAEQ